MLISALLVVFSADDVPRAARSRLHAVPPGTEPDGPFGLLQPIADGIKLFFKEEAMPEGASRWAFVAAPIVSIATAFTAIAVIPYGPPVAHARPGRCVG